MAGNAEQGLTVTALIAGIARRAPESAAIEYDGAAGRGSLTYGALDALGRRLARGLADLGVGRGDRIALWLPNVPAWLALYLGCARLGAVAVSVNTRFRSAEVADMVGRSGAKVLALWPGFGDVDFLEILSAVDPAALAPLDAVIVCDGGDEDAAVLPPALAALPAGCRTVRYSALAACPPYDGDLAAPDAGCIIFATSGTTSAPKFVLHAQAGIVRHACDVARDFALDAGDAAALQALPLCGVFGFSQAMATLAAGCKMTLMPGFDAERAAALVRARRITFMAATDGMYRQMLEARGEAEPFPSLRLACFAAFGTEAEDMVAEADRRGLALVGLYGMSEIQALFARQRVEDAAAVRGCAGGWPVSAPAAAVRVRDPDSGRLLGHGDAGELEASGPSLMAGYFEDRGASAVAMTEDGFVRTGDLAHTLADGSFVFHARMGDALRLGGFLVNPAEIEDFVLRHPTVSGCQVVGVEQDGRTRPFAFVTLAAGVPFDEAALGAHCAAGMARFKLPVGFHAIDAFPVTRSPNGTKIQRARLREMALGLVEDG